MIATTPALTIQLCSAETLDSAFADFRRDYSAYDSTHMLDELRATEFSRLDTLGHVYLDYTGGSLYPESLVREHMALLRDGVFGNPHSKNLTSLAMTALVEQARDYVLHYFNADPDEYVAIFTPNAIGALRLIGESYPFASGGNYMLTCDNHNSVNGIREFARTQGATVTYIPSVPPDMRVDPCALQNGLAMTRPGAHNLFAYPAQSNFTGVQHPLEWIAEAQVRGWDVLVDAASFVPAKLFVGAQVRAAKAAPPVVRRRRSLPKRSLIGPHRQTSLSSLCDPKWLERFEEVGGFPRVYGRTGVEMRD